MRECIVLASIASRKSVAIAKSVRGLLGLRVVGVAHAIHPHVFSKYFDRVHLVRVDRYSASWAHGVAGIAKEYGCKGVLPIDFADFYTFTKFSGVFEELGLVLMAPSHESIATASSRIRCAEVLADVAPFPRQVLVRSSEDSESIYSLRPPLVVKGIGDSSNPAFHLDHETAVEEAISRAPVVVQEFVEGVARGYYALAFNGVPILEFTHQREVEYLPIGGASLLAEGLVRDPVLVGMGRRIIEKLRWSGVLMVETKYLDEKGLYYVIELNPKFWGSVDLSESLGYPFSALLAALYLHGREYAEELKKMVKVREGAFAWVLDALRYMPKIPSVWLRVLRASLGNPVQCDADATDLARGAAQVLVALKRFKRERELWKQYLDKSAEQARAWVRRYARFLSSSKRVVIFDFDATLVRLPVDWAMLRRRMVEEKFVYPWESINRAFTRHWATDGDSYTRFSDTVKRYELNALSGLRVLVEPRLLKSLGDFAELCIATKQPEEVVVRALSKLHLSDVVEHIVGRDSGFGPVKTVLYKRCLEACKGSEALVVDDNIEYLVETYRLGLIPLHVASDPYQKAKAYRIGFPSDSINGVLSLILSGLAEYATL